MSSDIYHGSLHDGSEVAIKKMRVKTPTNLGEYHNQLKVTVFDSFDTREPKHSLGRGFRIVYVVKMSASQCDEAVRACQAFRPDRVGVSMDSVREPSAVPQTTP